MILLACPGLALFRVRVDALWGFRSPDIGAFFVDTELCEKSSGRLSLSFNDFVEVCPVVACSLGEFSHATHLLRHNSEKFEDLRSREAMDCDFVCHMSQMVRM
jgi:hypothetical protein